MVKHDISVQGVDLKGTVQSKPVLLQMNDDDFPNAFLQDLSSMPPPAPGGIAESDPWAINKSFALANFIGRAQRSSAKALPAAPSTPVTLYQPVTRVVHLALVQLGCESPGYPRVDPRRVLSAGLVIRQVPLNGGQPAASWAWMQNAKRQFAWVPRDLSHADDDPDPTKRPQLQSGRPDLDQLLAAQTLSTAMAESTTPAFVAAPDVCNAAQRTLVYALVPTASSEADTQHTPSVGQLDHKTIRHMLTTLLKGGQHSAPFADHCVDYQYMSDIYAKSKKATDFQTFSATLRLLYTAFGAFDTSNPLAVKLLNVLDGHYVTIRTDSGDVRQPMGQFYQEAAAKLIDYDPNANPPLPVPELKMPCAWDSFSHADEKEILNAMAPLLQSQGNAAVAPQGRFQDATRLYRARLFFRIKSENPNCPPELVWSCYSDPFRIGAWYESSGRVVAPVPLPDPFNKSALQQAKPTSSFAVPASLMNAMNGASLTSLSAGTAPASGGGGIGITWLCSFSIPLITICAFFVLNIFLSLLNIVFFWMAFIKICIPIPTPKD